MNLYSEDLKRLRLRQKIKVKAEAKAKAKAKNKNYLDSTDLKIKF